MKNIEMMEIEDRAMNSIVHQQGASILRQAKKIPAKRAWSVSCSSQTDAEYIVFAESRAKAAYIAQRMDELEDIGYIDIDVSRYPEADYFLERDPKLEYLSWAVLEHRIFLRCQGWGDLDGDNEECCATCSHWNEDQDCCNETGEEENGDDICMDYEERDI